MSGGYHALLLAAGAGTRFGGGKLLAPWRGEPIVRRAARTALAAPVDAVIAVTGCDDLAVRAALGGLGTRLRIRHATDWADGLSASLRAGLAALPDRSRGVVVFLGDMPGVDPGDAARLLARLDAGATAAEMRLDGRPAHPVAFGTALFADLRRLRGDAGGRGLLAGRTDVARVEAHSAGAIWDVDEPDDLARGPDSAEGLDGRQIPVPPLSDDGGGPSLPSMTDPHPDRGDPR